jgi:hypothetical protein
MRKALVVAAIMIAVLAGVIVMSLWIWGQIGDTEMSVHGYIALGLGVVATLVIGGGLMGLVFYSSRHGYDDGVGREDDS